ncbi:MAG TPA: hypothetical protein VL749_09195 [Patescibacteria group bacterium]|nr:hypothetical protein [Patescibacteria group bacterium]
MIDRVLFDWAPAAIVVVVGAFFADYLLTHLGARASQRVRDRWSVEGSYEMNPTWERQIDSGRLFGVRVFGVAALLAALLGAARLLSWAGGELLDPAFFAFAVGSIALLQAPVLMVHAANLQTFRDLADPTAVEGGVHYRRWFVYRQGAAHLVRFAVLWLLLWLPSQQAFFLGGALSCLIFARRLARLGVAARRAVDVAPETIP